MNKLLEYKFFRFLKRIFANSPIDKTSVFVFFASGTFALMAPKWLTMALVLSLCIILGILLLLTIILWLADEWVMTK